MANKLEVKKVPESIHGVPQTPCERPAQNRINLGKCSKKNCVYICPLNRK